MTIISERLQHLRLTHGYTQTELARTMGVSRRAVYAWEHDKCPEIPHLIQYGEEHGLHGTSEVLQMRERVRKEWWSICGKTYNVCERPAYLINCLEFQVSFSLAFYFISVFRYT